MPKPVAARPRPYFLPASIDIDSLPKAVQTAFDTIILPAYDKLVLGTASPLERAAGATFVFLLTEELLDQFELAQSFNLSQSTPPTDRETRAKALQRHLRLVSSKQSALNSLLKIRSLPHQLGSGPWDAPTTSVD